MGFVDLESGIAAEPPPRTVLRRSRPSRLASEFEFEVRQLYMRIMDEPVPPRLLEILHAALPSRS